MSMRQKTLYVTIGLPGSGKSYLYDTFYASPHVACVSSDAIRESMFGSAYIQSDPDKVFLEFLRQVQEKLSWHGIRAVYADATHIRKDWRKDILALAKRLGVGNVRAIVVKPSIIRAWKQDRQRKKHGFRYVGLKTILKYAWMWQKPSFDEGFTSIEVIDYEIITPFGEIQ